MTDAMRIAQVVGARPNFMKVAPVMHAVEQSDGIEQLVIHTGQHYDASLSGDFFGDLGLPQADFNLAIGSGSHAEQTGRTLLALEPLLQRLQPSWVFTVGDVNSTQAAGGALRRGRAAPCHVYGHRFSCGIPKPRV